MIKCAVIGCWNMAPNKSGLCSSHQIEGRLERAKRMDRGLIDVDKLVGLEREQAPPPHPEQGNGG